MNHKKIKKQINKINSFFESITADDEISKIVGNCLSPHMQKAIEETQSSSHIMITCQKQ